MSLCWTHWGTDKNMKWFMKEFWLRANSTIIFLMKEYAMKPHLLLIYISHRRREWAAQAVDHPSSSRLAFTLCQCAILLARPELLPLACHKSSLKWQCLAHLNNGYLPLMYDCISPCSESPSMGKVCVLREELSQSLSEVQVLTLARFAMSAGSGRGKATGKWML